MKLLSKFSAILLGGLLLVAPASAETRAQLTIRDGGELFSELDMFVELSDRQKAGIAGERRGRNFDFDGSRGEKIEGKEWDRV